MMRSRAIGYRRRDVSGVRQQWDENQIRSLAKRSGFDLTKIVVFGEHADHPVFRLCTVVARLRVDAVFTPSIDHFDGAVPEDLTNLADVVTVADRTTYTRVNVGCSRRSRLTVYPWGLLETFEDDEDDESSNETSDTVWVQSPVKVVFQQVRSSSAGWLKSRTW